VKTINIVYYIYIYIVTTISTEVLGVVQGKRIFIAAAQIQVYRNV
jgi:hypothetical protein